MSIMDRIYAQHDRGAAPIRLAICAGPWPGAGPYPSLGYQSLPPRAAVGGLVRALRLAGDPHADFWAVEAEGGVIDIFMGHPAGRCRLAAKVLAGLTAEQVNRHLREGACAPLEPPPETPPDGAA